MGAEIFGDPLPHSIAGWLILFSGILGSLLIVLQAAEDFAKRLGIHRQINRPYGGLALPFSWAAWCIMLLIGRHDVVSVLIVLLGTLTFTVTAQRLVQKCKQ